MVLGAHILQHLRVRGFWLLRTYVLVRLTDRADDIDDLFAFFVN